MNGTTRSRRTRFGIVAALALAIGVLSPSLVAPTSASATESDEMITPASGNIQSKVGDGCVGNPRDHDGIDITPRNGGSAPIVAAADGVIKSKANGSRYGYYVDVQHSGGYVTRYAHMQAPSPLALGASVAQGDEIGKVGNSGTVAPHLHFEVYRNGSIYTAVNDAFTCLDDVTRGDTLPISFPGLFSLNGSGARSADYNGDGNADLLAISTSGQMTAYNGDGALGWNAVTLGTGWATTRSIVHGDYNSDGKGDFVSVRTDGTLWFYRGVGNNAFQATQVGHGWGNIRLITGGADFTDDQRADLVAVGTDNKISVYPGSSSGSFGAATSIGSGWGNIDMILAGDFGTDGRGDILARTTAGALLLYGGNGTGLLAPYQVGNGWSGMTAITGGVDYGQDGYADVIARDAAGDLWLYPGLGGSGFGSQIKVGASWNGHRIIT